MMLRSSVKPTVAAKASSGRQVKIQAVSRDADSTMVQKLATGALAAVVAAGALLPAPVMAADLALGKQVFEGNCAACHSGGGNSVIPDHTLQKAAIEQFLTGGLTLEAITYQVENGKGAMPAWDGTLDDDEIQAVSAYVYDQATGSKW